MIGILVMKLFKDRFLQFSLLLVIGFAFTLTLFQRNLDMTSGRSIKSVYDAYEDRAYSLLQMAQGIEIKEVSQTYKILSYWIFAGVHSLTPGASPKFQFLLAQWLINFFSLWMFFLCAQFVYKDYYKSFFALFFIGLFFPLLIMPFFAFGMALLLGIYFAIVYATLSRNNFLFFIFVMMGSFVRQDLACCAILFKGLYDYFILQKRRLRDFIVTAVVLFVPLFSFLAICRYFELSDSSDYTGILGYRFLSNLISLRSMVLLFFPLLAFWGIVKFKWDRVCLLMFISILPYVFLVTLLGNFTESRLILPVVAVLILNVGALIKLASPSLPGSLA